MQWEGRWQRFLRDESAGAVGLLGSVGDVGAPLEIFREENIKVGAVDVNSLPSHGPHRLPPTQHHQLRFLELYTAVPATVFLYRLRRVNVSRHRFLTSANDVPALVAGRVDLVL